MILAVMCLEGVESFPLERKCLRKFSSYDIGSGALYRSKQQNDLAHPFQSLECVLELILDLQIHDGANPSKRIGQGGKQRFVPMADHMACVDRLENLLDFFRTERWR